MREGMSLERASTSEGGIMVEVALIVYGDPQHASLFSPVADIPSPTSSVPEDIISRPCLVVPRHREKIPQWARSI